MRSGGGGGAPAPCSPPRAGAGSEPPSITIRRWPMRGGRAETAYVAAELLLHLVGERALRADEILVHAARA